MQTTLPITLPARVGAGLARAWDSVAFWRYAELVASRGAPLFLHTFLLMAYGAASYAYPAWVLGVVALVSAFLPDTSSYILVRAHGEAAWRLAKAAVPYMWLKTAITLVIGGATSLVLGSTTLVEGLEQAQIYGLVAGALLYSAADQLWGFSSQVSLARGTLRRVTLTGIAAKAAGLGAVGVLHLSGHASVAADLIAYAAITLTASLCSQPGPASIHRTLLFNRFALTHYALWAQGASLLTAVVTQAIPQGAGLITGVSASTVGQLVYAFRWLGVSAMLLQVLQSLVTQANRVVFGRANQHSYQALVRVARKHEKMRPLYLAFRWGGMASGVLGTLGAVAAFSLGLIAMEVAVTLTLYSIGMGLFSSYRFELALAVSRGSAKSLLLRGLVPVFSLGSAVTCFATLIYGLSGLGAGVALTFGLFASAWRRVK